MYLFVVLLLYLFLCHVYRNIICLHLQTLHQLTARAIIRDWTEGSLSTDKMEHEVLIARTENPEKIFSCFLLCFF